MTLKISPDHVMVPRRDQKSRSSWIVEEEKEIETSHISYAPPGASLNANVRRLKDREQKIIVGKVVEENRSEDVIEVESNGNGSSKRGLVFKIEAEVTVIGDLPEEGIAVETTTLLKSVKKDR